MSNINQINSPELCAFDYDGTVAWEKEARIASSVLLGVRALWYAGVASTVITARPYQRLAMLSNGVDNLVSANTPLATERGARIVNKDLTSNLNYIALTNDELNAIIDIEPREDIDFIGFYPKELHGESYIWSPDPARNQTMEAKFGHDAIILSNEIDDLNNALQQVEPCLVTVKFKVGFDDRSVLPDEMNTAWDRRAVSVVARGVDKLNALQIMCDHLNTAIPDTIYAGNDDNDLPVLQNLAIRERIFVGDKNVVGMAEPITRIRDPEELGNYFLDLAGVSK